MISRELKNGSVMTMFVLTGIITMALLLSPAAVIASGVASTLKGHVQNSVNGAGINGARIEFWQGGVKIAVTTSINAGPTGGAGFYTRSFSSGITTIKVFATGYQNTIITNYNVPEGSSTLNITMTPTGMTPSKVSNISSASSTTSSTATATLTGSSFEVALIGGCPKIIGTNATVLKLSGEVETWYSCIQDAYDDASSGDEILILATEYNGDLTFDRPISILLQGGYSQDFSSVAGVTVLNGKLKISDGAVTIKSFVTAK